MAINFDQVIDRAGSHSLKFDGRKAKFGTDDVMPLWVADMDFAAPVAVTEVLTQRASHPVYGYTLYPDSLYSAMRDWFKSHHNWSFDRQSILMCPGVVPSIHAAILALSKPGDGVIVQPPVYPPLFTAVTETQRELILNPLKLEQNRYKIDFEHLEQCAASGAKLLLLCSPHNPTGRVWQQDELEAMLAIARRYQLTIISDEIHADLVYSEQRHIPLATLSDDVPIVTAVAPSKTFNIPGMGLSSLVVNKTSHRRAINKVFDSWHIYATNPFSIAAFEAAYRGGKDWLDELLVYIAETRRQAAEFIDHNLPKIKLVDSEGTYLLWIDCRALAMSDDELQQFFINKAKIGLNPGISFGDAGSGFMRMNIGTRRSMIMQALKNIQQACE
ncbi:MAG: pyridoxal phosphate-dependent aminotransferase [Gammaproteobacteria bacterium]|nr:pyridoxal phosphate-dependent aminotransferase [Gammaproteobacteria bacterium]